MVSAILLHYVIDDPLPTRGTFLVVQVRIQVLGADNFFFFLALNVFLFSHMLSSFLFMFLLHKLPFYLVCTVASCYIIIITYQVEKKTKSGNVM